MTEINNIDFNSYLKIMNEINDRFIVINSIFELEDDEENNDYLYAFSEICATQLRIIIELISIASYLVNKDIIDYNTIKNDWSASRIVGQIRKKNNLFFPIPAKVNSEDLLSIRSSHRKIFSEQSTIEETINSTKGTVFDIYDKIQKYCHCGSIKTVINDNRCRDNEEIKKYVRQVYSIISSHVFITGKKRNALCVIGNKNVTVYSLDIDDNLSNIKNLVFDRRAISNSKT